MPYEVGEPQVFRDILKELHDNRRMSDEKAINLAHAHIKAQTGTQNVAAPFELTRASLYRFRTGGNIINVRDLERLWVALENQPEYAYAFRLAVKEDTLDMPEQAMARALQQYFPPSNVLPAMAANRIRSRLAGRYTLYRPGWRKGAPNGLLMTSLFEVVDVASTVCVSETQSFVKSESDEGYYQKDHGFLFTIGNAAYFFCKQDSGTAVKLFAADSILPLEEGQPVTSFSGLAYVSSSIKLYPSVKFFCLRTEIGNVPSTYVSLDDIPNLAARAHFATVEVEKGTTR